VLFVGWILEAKGVRELLQAARALPEARFTLVGPPEPSFVATIEDELRALGDRVRVLPALPREEIFRLYREADVFVLPTWREGFPNVVLEAMASGALVVAAPVGEVPSLVEEGETGLLFRPGDAADLARALLAARALSAGGRKAMTARARKRVEDRYRIERVAAGYLDLYEGLAAKRARR
jgi:glycosyltransferase involved in cell wall biosynthesis